MTSDKVPYAVTPVTAGVQKHLKNDKMAEKLALHGSVNSTLGFMRV